MLPELRDLYAGVAVHATEDDEHAAALELLILVMRADRKLRLDESDEIETLRFQTLTRLATFAAWQRFMNWAACT